MTAVLALIVAALLAHGGEVLRDSADHRPVVDRLVPAVAGITVRLADEGTRLELDAGDHEVVVLGYEGEPYLLVDEGGVFENVLSPSTYLNRSMEGEAPPPEASFRSPPRWERIGEGPVVRWHDHALHVPPGQAMGTRDESSWSVPLRVDGEQVRIEGRMLTRPPVSATPWLLLAAAAAVGAVASLRFTGRRATLALLAVVAVLEVVRLGGIVFGTPTWLASRWEVLSAEWTLSIVGIGLTAAAVVLAGRGRDLESAVAALVGAGVLALAGGVLELDDLSARSVVSAVPDGGHRATVALVLGLGLGVAMRAALALTPGWSTPAPPAPRSGNAPNRADGRRRASPSRPASG